jgi:LysR family glycine cleavage system transcriptional activator
MTRSDLPPLTALVAFEAAARRLNFARAAEELYLTPSAVSHQIAKLEQFLGFLLFERTPRGIMLSDAGESYFKRVAGALGAIGNATNDVRKGARNTLYVHSNPSIASLWLMPRLGQFVRAFPDISLSLSASPVYSDFALGQVDVDIRYGVPEWPNLVVEPISEERILPLASPGLLARLSVSAPSDLLQCPLIQSTVSLVQWPAWFASQALIGVPEHFAFRFDRASMSLEAAVQGLGVALESGWIASPHIEAGRLRPVFHPGWSLPIKAHFMVYPERHAQRTEVAQFVAWVREQAGTKSA